MSEEPNGRTCSTLYVSAAVVVVGVGVLGLESASPLRQWVESWMNIHALFGLLLCALVFARYRGMIHHPLRLQPDIRELSRHLSRIVYLTLYLVMGVGQGISLLNCLRQGGPVDLTPFNEGFRPNDDVQLLDPHHDCHMILLCGGLVLAMIRVFLTGCLVPAIAAKFRSPVGSPAPQLRVGPE